MAQDLKAIADSMAAAVIKRIAADLAPINARLAAAESDHLAELESLIARVKALEDRLGL